VGALIVKPIRHVLHVADLDDDEVAEMGPMLRRAALVVEALCEPDQVYVCLWSHAGFEPVHIHFVVQPVHSDQARELGLTGPRYQAAQFDAGVEPDRDEVLAFCTRARAEFAR
jgi:diadenosine tetraphosphate (Ap4A) HIT family hydrolase